MFKDQKLQIIRKRIEYFLKNVFIKVMFTFTIFDILPF